MSPEERNVDIQPEAIPSQPSRPKKPESVFSRALRRGVQAAVAIATVLGISGDAEARDVSDEELSEVASELGFTSIEDAVESDLADSRDLSTQLHPDGSGRLVFSHKLDEVGGLWYRESLSGEDSVYPDVRTYIDSEGMLTSGNFRFIAEVDGVTIAVRNTGGLYVEDNEGVFAFSNKRY